MDGMLDITTTDFNDAEIHHYALYLRESNSDMKLTKLPSILKNGAKFSGTEVVFTVSTCINYLVDEITLLFQKMLILNTPNIVYEIVLQSAGVTPSPHRWTFMANDDNSLLHSASNLERMRIGFESYIANHGNNSSQRDHFKVESATLCSSDNQCSSRMIVDVVIIISELDPSSSCLMGNNSKTKVVYFEDFIPCSMSQSNLRGLSSIDWKSYGLTLQNTEEEKGQFLVWDSLPHHTCMSIAIHCYQNKHSRHKPQSSSRLIKRAVKLTLDKLKEKHADLLLSGNTLKVLSYVPEVAKSVAHLILSSNDETFQGECFKLLGMGLEQDAGAVENCIKHKITSAIQRNESDPQGDTEAIPFLFEDEHHFNMDIEEEGFE